MLRSQTIKITNQRRVMLPPKLEDIETKCKLEENNRENDYEDQSNKIACSDSIAEITIPNLVS